MEQTDKEFDYHAIDRYRLDDEWVRQDKEYGDHIRRAAEARYEWDLARTDKDLADAELERVAARLDRLVRQKPTDYGLPEGKSTEGAIKAAVLLHDKYVRAQQAVFDAQRRVVEAKHTLDVADAAVKTLDNRNSALTNLTKLQLSDYYQETKLPAAVADHRAAAECAAAFGRGRRRE